MYVGCSYKNDIFRNDVHISIIKLTSTKSWNKSFSFLQALANPAAFSEHQTTVSRKRLMPLNDVYFNMENMPLFSKFRLLTFMQINIRKSADLTLTRLFQFVFRFCAILLPCVQLEWNIIEAWYKYNYVSLLRLRHQFIYESVDTRNLYILFKLLYDPCFVIRSYDKQLPVYHCKYQFKGIKTDEILWS